MRRGAADGAGAAGRRSSTSRAPSRSTPISSRSTSGTRRACARSARSGAGPTASATASASATPRPRTSAPASPTRARRWSRRCAELGIVFDLAHMNEAGFWDAAELGAAPLVVSHAGAHAICPNSRYLTDAQIDAVGETGGLVGIVFAPAFLRPDGKNQTDRDPARPDRPPRPPHRRPDRRRARRPRLRLRRHRGPRRPRRRHRPAAACSKSSPSTASATTEIEAIAWGNWRRTLARCWNEA